jgi:hypothetical protein
MDKTLRFMHDEDYVKLNHAIDTFKAALAQQEPVEIKPPNPEGATQCIVRWFAETPAGWVGAWDREALERFTANPPRREWQSLTEEEIDALFLPSGSVIPFYRAMARVVEQALKERNT